MVKSGEVYSASQLEKDAEGYTINRSDRPRNICIASDFASGYATAVQSTFWAFIKRILPGFIQGLTKDQFQQTIRDNIQEDWESISIDGSSFDSTQFDSLMMLVDDVFTNTVIDRMTADLQQCCTTPMIRSRSVMTQVHENLRSSMLNHDSILFTHVPGINGAPWPKFITEAWKRDHSRTSPTDRPWLDWLATPVRGTTFSGHPWRTTLFNTFRSMCYAYFFCV